MSYGLNHVIWNIASDQIYVFFSYRDEKQYNFHYFSYEHIFWQGKITTRYENEGKGR